MTLPALNQSETSTGSLLEGMPPVANLQLAQANAVAIVTKFNPSLINQAWLVKRGITDEASFQQNCMFVDGLSQIVTDQFEFVATTDRLQFAPRLLTVDNQDAAIVGRFADILRGLDASIPSVIGFNFQVNVAPPGRSVQQIVRRLFFRPEPAIYQAFDVDNAYFGGYFSKDFGPMRLRLDVRPVTLKSPTETHGLLVAAFNFSYSLVNLDSRKEIENLASNWTAAKTEAKSIAELLLQ